MANAPSFYDDADVAPPGEKCGGAIQPNVIGNTVQDNFILKKISAVGSCDTAKTSVESEGRQVGDGAIDAHTREKPMRLAIG